MTPTTARSNCLSLNKRRDPAASGYALVTLMIMVAVLLISLTAALPSIYQEGQREREAETLFRGQQYARAIYLFYRQFGRYPTSVKDLLNTSGARFLREPYRDPLSRDGRWRFIHAVNGGILIDSWNQTTITPGSPQGAATTPGNMTGSSSAGAANSTMFSADILSAGAAGKGKPKHPPSTCDAKNNSAPGKFGDESYQTGVLMGAYIIGVAPCNSRQSIRVVNHEDHYDHWEFIALKYREYALPKSSSVNGAPAGAPSLSPPDVIGNPASSPGSPAPNPGPSSGP